MKRFLFIILAMVVHIGVGKTVSLQLIDDLAQPIEGADVCIVFKSTRTDQPGDIRYLKSDKEGRVVVSGETLVGFFIKASKEGYYAAQSAPPYIPVVDMLKLTWVLPRVLNPIPLYADRFSRGTMSSLKIPVQNIWVGYDFEANDWVAPHGRGKIADLQFRFKNEFKGYLSEGENLERALEISRTLAVRSGKSFSEEEFKLSAGKWDGVLEISFPNPRGGLLEETERYLPYSELKLPHLAPESGYEPTRRYEANTYRMRQPERQVGFFLRTRVVLDADGDIVSAHYAKIYGDIYFDPRGTLNFWYYYNPTSNDRNLEFDPKHNLFPPKPAGAEVRNP